MYLSVDTKDILNGYCKQRAITLYLVSDFAYSWTFAKSLQQCTICVINAKIVLNSCGYILYSVNELVWDARNPMICRTHSEHCEMEGDLAYQLHVLWFTRNKTTLFLIIIFLILFYIILPDYKLRVTQTVPKILFKHTGFLINI